MSGLGGKKDGDSMQASRWPHCSLTPAGLAIALQIALDFQVLQFIEVIACILPQIDVA